MMRRIIFSVVACAAAMGAAAAFAQEQPADAPADRVSELSSLLDGMPDDAAPDPATGWDKFSIVRAQKWLEADATGKRCRILLPIESIQVQHSPNRATPDREWSVTVRTGEPKPFVFRNIATTPSVAGDGAAVAGWFTLRLTEEAAKRADQLKAGDSIAINGHIERPRLSGDGRSASLHVRVKSLDIDLYPNDPPADQPKAGDAPAPEPAKSEPAAKPFTTVRQMLDGMPPDAGPAPNKGWDQFTRPKGLRWLRDNSIGKPVRFSVKVRTISTRLDRQEQDPARSWKADIQVDVEDFAFRGVPLGIRLYNSSSFSPFYLRGDEAFAKRMEKVQHGRPIALEGVVKDVSVTTYDGGKTVQLTVYITDYAIPSLK